MIKIILQLTLAIVNLTLALWILQNADWYLASLNIIAFVLCFDYVIDKLKKL